MGARASLSITPTDAIFMSFWMMPTSVLTSLVSAWSSSSTRRSVAASRFVVRSSAAPRNELFEVGEVYVQALRDTTR